MSESSTFELPGSSDRPESDSERETRQMLSAALRPRRLKDLEGRTLQGDVSQWKLEQLLETGGQGGVFRGRQVFNHDAECLSRPVAIKVVEPDESGTFFHDPAAEARILLRFDHENIVRVFDFGREGSAFWMVMQLLDGQTLQQRLNQNAGEPLPPAEALPIARHVLSALEEVRRLGLVHLDIKPSNIFLTTDGKVKVLDLGLAHFCHPVTGSRSLPVARGTLRYASPEQLGDEPAGDHRSDIYSLGATLFHMLVGEPPFPEARGFLEIRELHRQGQVPDPRQARPDVSEIYAAIVRQAMAKDPLARFQSATEFKAALARAESKPRSRRRIWTAALLFGFVALTAIGVTISRQGKQPTATPNRTPAGAVRPAEPHLTELRFYVRQQTDQQPFVWDLDKPETQIDLTLRPGKDQDNLMVEGTFDQAVQWHILWHDTQGKWFRVESSAGPGETFVYPGRRGPEEQVAWIDPADPPGVHMLYVVAGQVSVEQLDALLQHPPVNDPPPVSLGGHTGDLRGVQTGAGEAISTAGEYLDAVRQWLPPEFTTVRFIPLVADKRN